MAVAGVAGCRNLLCSRLEGEGKGLEVRLPPPPGASERRSVCARSGSIVRQLPPLTPPLTASEDAEQRGFKFEDILNTPSKS